MLNIYSQTLVVGVKDTYQAFDADLLSVGSMIDRTKYMNEEDFAKSLNDQVCFPSHKLIHICSISNMENRRYWQVYTAERHRIMNKQGTFSITIFLLLLYCCNKLKLLHYRYFDGLPISL